LINARNLHHKFLEDGPIQNNAHSCFYVCSDVSSNERTLMSMWKIL